MFKVSPEHLRHATLEERAVAQSDGREMLGIAQYVGENGSLRGSRYVDLTQQGSPEVPDSPTAARPTAEHAPSQASSVPSPASAVAQLVSPDNMDVVAPGEIVEKSPAEPESVGRDTQCLQHRFRQDNLVLQVLPDRLDIDTMERNLNQ